MQVGNVGCGRQAFAVASSNDSSVKKTRIRLSKEERKSIAESFIKKYQNSNNGNFPSLNLTHKEVGGSFYTVREIVREIIQENRVLAPPKVSPEEHGLSEFLEKHPLGSISMEPVIDLSVSDRGDVLTHIAPNENQFSSVENVSTSNESYELAVQDGGTNRTSENIVNGFVVADHHKGIDEGAGSQMLSYDQTVDKDKEFGERIYTEPTAIKNLDQEKLEAQNVESSPSFISHMSSGIVVETFPLRPVPNKMAEESGKLHEATETLEDKGTGQEKKTFTQRSSGFDDGEGDNKLPHSTLELNGENRDVKVVLNLQGPLMENAKHPSKTSEVETGGIEELESKDSLPDGAKASRSTKTLISEDSTAAVGKFSDRDSSTVAKGNNPTLDRINLETWDRAAKKSPQPESNPLLLLVKSIISSFVKFWTE